MFDEASVYSDISLPKDDGSLYVAAKLGHVHLVQRMNIQSSPRFRPKTSQANFRQGAVSVARCCGKRVHRDCRDATKILICR